jgi:hypothetical protein
VKSLKIPEVRFHCADQVAVTKSDKALLWNETRADAVEMESSHIQMVCRQRGIRCDVIRVVSDSAEEDLPLDFSKLMTADHRMRWGKLFFHLSTHPTLIPRLMRFQKQLKRSARRLAEALHQVVLPKG